MNLVNTIREWPEKRKDLLLLALLWSLFFIPYIAGGGLLRDDLGYAAYPRQFTDYLTYQKYFSSMESLNGRPVYGLQLGISYWLFGTAAWKFHLVNLSLFGGSILFFYLALRKIISRRFAILAACAALVYPCASGNLFASVMTNYNLAGLGWCAALYLTVSTGKGRGAGIFLLFLLSALSYEAFIPLFAVLFFVEPFLQKEGTPGILGWLRRSAPLGAAFLAWLVYRVLIEFVLGIPSYRLHLSSPTGIVNRYWNALMTGLHVLSIDSLKLSVRAFRDLPLVPWLQWIAVVAGLAGLAFYLYRILRGEGENPPEGRQCARQFVERFTTIRIAGLPYLDLFLFSLSTFCCSFAIFALSDYLPTIEGFENRTMGAVRFPAAMLAAVVVLGMHAVLVDRKAKRLLASGAVGLVLLFSLSMIGQREAWIAAAHYNDKLLADVNAALLAGGLTKEKAFTLVVEMPDTFPGEVNKEPIFGWPWDIGTALAFSNPGIDIHTVVYNPSQTQAFEEKILIYGFYEGKYPFFFYSYKTGCVIPVASKEDWEMVIRDTSEKTHCEPFEEDK